MTLAAVFAIKEGRFRHRAAHIVRVDLQNHRKGILCVDQTFRDGAASGDQVRRQGRGNGVPVPGSARRPLFSDVYSGTVADG